MVLSKHSIPNSHKCFAMISYESYMYMNKKLSYLILHAVEERALAQNFTSKGSPSAGGGGGGGGGGGLW